MAADGSVRQQHFEDINRQPDLGALLSQVVIAMLENQSELPASSH